MSTAHDAGDRLARAPSAHPDASAAAREIRVFVSSTFRDMQEERDHLAKFVFPRLRKLCEARGVTWGEVDLRWGITDEEKAEGRALSLCLDEINRCRPYFIGLLGERYGWVPQGVSDDLLSSQPWLKGHSGCSVTELEMVHGVLRDQQMRNRAYVYFRNPDYLKALPADRLADFAAENEQSAAKLTRLKETVRQAGAGQLLRLRENYRDPTELGQWILSDFAELIEGLFPRDQPLDQLTCDAVDHAAFARSRARVYIGRADYFERLDAHARGSYPPLTVVGASGSGKSALLANWTAGYRTRHPDDCVIEHFIGAVPASADWVAMLRRIMGECQRQFGIEETIPDTSDLLRPAFAQLLHMAAARGRVVLVLDALNQLEDRDGALDLAWLPTVIPANIRVVLSTLPGRPLDELRRRGFPQLEVAPMTRSERIALVVRYLSQYSKSLDHDRVERIVDGRASSNPLYLRAVLEELRLLGSHERLDDLIAAYLQANTIVALYQLIFARWEADYSCGHDLVRKALPLLCAARRGLSEAELLDVVGDPTGPLPHAYWSPLFLAAETALTSRSGLLAPFHDYMREACWQRYAPTDAERGALHLRLAAYFQGAGPSDREVEELPWHLMKARRLDLLFALLSDPDFIVQAYPRAATELGEYWARVEEAGGQIVEGYRAVIEAPLAHLAALGPIARLLQHRGRHQQAYELLYRLGEHQRGEEALPDYAETLAAEASSLVAMQRLVEAADIELEREQTYRKLGDGVGVAASLAEQSRIAFLEGDSAEALVRIEEQEAACRKLDDRRGLQAVLDLKARCLTSLEELRRAKDVNDECDRLSRELGSRQGLARSYEARALLFKHDGRSAEARVLLEQSEQMWRELGDTEGLATCLEEQTRLLRRGASRDESARGLTMARELQGLIETVRGDIGGSNPERLARSLLWQAEFLAGDAQRKDQALAACDEIDAIYAYRLNMADVGKELTRDLRRNIQRGIALKRADIRRQLMRSVLPGTIGLLLGLWHAWLWIIGAPLVAFAVIMGADALRDHGLLPRPLQRLMARLERFIDGLIGRYQARELRINALFNQGWRRYLRGETEEALASFAAMMSLARSWGRRAQEARALSARADILEARGDPEAAAARQAAQALPVKEKRNWNDRHSLAEANADWRRAQFQSRIDAVHADAFAARGANEEAANRYAASASVVRRHGELARANELYEKAAKSLEENSKGEEVDGVRFTPFASWILHSTGNLNRLLAPRKHQEAMWRAANQPSELAVAIGNQALVLGRLIERSQAERRQQRFSADQIIEIIADETQAAAEALALAREAQSTAEAAGATDLATKIAGVVAYFEQVSSG